MKHCKIMQPLHVVVPEDVRELIVQTASHEGVSIAVIARELLNTGIRARGLCVNE